MSKADPAPPTERQTRLPREIRSDTLLHGGRTLTILHHGERYTLRRTARDKLILTK